MVKRRSNRSRQNRNNKPSSKYSRPLLLARHERLTWKQTLLVSFRAAAARALMLPEAA